MTKKAAPPGGYDVGYGKPPRHTRFRKGRSGNRAGRKPRAPSLKSAIRNELAESIAISDKGVRQEVTKMEALAKRLVSDALSGEPRALVELLRQVNIHLTEASEADAVLSASDEDAALLLDYVRRVTGRNPEGVKETNDEPSDDQ